MSSTIDTNSTANRVLEKDRVVHEWYRFVLSYPPHLVRRYLNKFQADASCTVLDPFCGTGTTVAECKKLGIPSIGIESHPMGHFASKVKTDWGVSPKRLLTASRKIAIQVDRILQEQGLSDDVICAAGDGNSDGNGLRGLPPAELKLLLKNSISALPLHKTLTLLDVLSHTRTKTADHQKLALSRALVTSIGNLHFGPEVGVRRVKPDSPVLSPWLNQIHTMVTDLDTLSETQKATPSAVYLADARNVAGVIEPNSVNIVITSPPYPNEKDYTRTTRLESVLLGFIRDRQQLRLMKQGLMRSNTRNVYVGDDDDKWIANHTQIDDIAKRIERRRIKLGKTSGFERLYGRVTKLYFGGMARHLSDLTTILKPGARLAYVVGDQASYLRIMIRTGQLLADIAEDIGYTVDGIDLFRTRLSTATKAQLREEVLLLTWPGKKRRKTATRA